MEDEFTHQRAGPSRDINNQRDFQRRSIESNERREERLTTQRERSARNRASRQAQSQDMQSNVGIQSIERTNNRLRQAAKRAVESEEEKKERLKKDRERAKQKKLQNQRITYLANSNSDLEELSIEEHSCGLMDFICDFCGSKNFKFEQPADKLFTNCCQKGKVKLPEIKFCDLMKNLMTGQHPHSENFMKKIRSFNSSLAFASMGANISSPPGYGPYCFRIHGQIYHRTGTLHPENGERRQFAQLYILDPTEASSERQDFEENEGCNAELMDELSRFMAINNPFAQAYKMLYQVENEAKEDAQRKNIPMTNIVMAIKQDREKDPRRYNTPTSNEVAVVFQNSDGSPPINRDILIHLKSNPESNIMKTQRISVLDKNLDPMTYPLFFPYGDQSWGPDIQLGGQGKRQRVTQMQFYSYILAVRETFNPFLNAGKLTQQFFVDAYCNMEANRLYWVQANQKNLRVEMYKGLTEHVRNQAAEADLIPGKPIILPSSFQGSPRNMHQNYQDAMAIVRKFGKPDLFITMTCNPKWADIVNNLEPNQRPENRPDLVARVFNIKKKALLSDISKNHIFGVPVAIVHVIEFQKRGLPHAHILIILNNESKIRTSDDIDKIVSAELPDPETNPRLFEIVTKHMVHGPCGDKNLRSPCMENNLCAKNFPKEFINETVANADGYPRYKRRNNKLTATVRGHVIDNTWVVPYNSFLLLKYNCHINVEVCATVKSVKYLFKYVYKGHDCASIELREKQQTLQHNEIKSFADSRYVSPPESAWRLNGFKMHEQSHSISRLQVHQEDEQNVVFDPNCIQEAIDTAGTRNTTLTAWFKLNQDDVSAREHLYHEIPEHYTFANGNWKKRLRGGDSVIGRMHSVSIQDAERYYLRLLLLHIPGATSFSYLKTINGVEYATFKEAASAKGLLSDERVWVETMEDGIGFLMPSQLRLMFATICVFSSPPNAKELWDTYKEHLSEDYSHNQKHPRDCECCFNMALLDIQETLMLHGKSCSNFQIPSPTIRTRYDPLSNIDVVQETIKGMEMYCNLNEEQYQAFEDIYSATQNSQLSAKCFFLDGPGGSGKTYLYNALISIIRGEGGVVLAVASTGIAANLLPGGRTYHSQYKLPVPILDISVSSMRENSVDAKLIKKANLLIWDESTMASTHALNAVDRLLQQLMRNNCPFGGKVMLLGGDFRQCLAIVPHASRSVVVQTCIKFFQHWNAFKTISLIHNVRSIDPDYSNWLLKLGNGEVLNEFGLEDDIVQIPPSMLTDSIISDIFGNNLTVNDIREHSKKAILSPINESVDFINKDILSILEGDSICYTSVDTIEDETEEDLNHYPIEFINGLCPSGMPPHKLHLKIGAIIMLLRNLNTKRGYCNGTRLIIKDLKPNIIVAEAITGNATGQTVFISRIDLTPAASTDLPFQLKRRQFPINLAFAMTINKSQGQTLEKVGIFLSEPVFGHGQLYVALSRVRRSPDVKIYIKEGKRQGQLIPGNKTVFTRNVVYKEVLNSYI